MQPTNRLRSFLLGFLALFFCSTLTQAQIDTTWTGNGDGVTWNDPANWSAGVPDSPGNFNAIIDSDNLNSAAVATSVSDVIDIDSLTVDSGDMLTIVDNNDFIIATDAGRPDSGAITNNGLIELLTSGNVTDLIIRDEVSLSGTGTLRIGGGSSNSRIVDNSGANGHLTNSSTIEGFGQIGANTLQITNLAGGLIDANSAGGVALTVDPNAGGGVTNQGTLRGSAGGNLILTSGNFANTGGVIEALDASLVTLQGSATFTGGTLQTTGTGVVRVLNSNVATLNDLTITGNFQQLDNSDLLINGTINNQSSDFTVTTAGNLTDVIIPTSATLSGGGIVTLGGANNNARIVDNSGGNGVLTNANHTIQGKGQVGANTLEIVNQAGGLINANDSSGTLVVDPNASGGLTNQGTMRASAGANLILQAGSFDNAGGVIEALDASKATITGSANITGGTLQTSGTGVLEIPGSAIATLDGVTITGTVQQLNNSDLILGATLINQSNDFTVNNLGNLTDIVVPTASVLSGGGTVTLAGSTNNSRITDNSGSNGVFTNVDNTLEGRGQIGANTLQIINQVGGVIDANSTGNTLTLDPNAAGGLQNQGTLRATNGGILVLAAGEFTNTGATIEATGAGSEVQMTNNAVITGGTVRSSSGGLVRVNASTNVFFADTLFEGIFQAANNSDLGISGTITNNAAMTMASLGNNTDIQVQASGATLTGNGKVILTSTGGNAAGIDGISNAVLTHGSAHTIEGQGAIGRNTIGIVNDGLIDANVNGQFLTIDPDAVTGMDNNSTLRASNGGLLLLTGNAGGVFTNEGGTIEATGADSEVRLITTASINGGTVRGFDGGLVRVNASQNVFFNNVTFEGPIQSDNNSDFGISGTITNNGTITMASAGNNTDVEVQAGGATLAGTGKVVLTTTSSNAAGINGVGNSVLTNSATHTIEGQGFIGRNTIGVVNQGLINANVAGQSLTFDPDAVNGLNNTGTIQSTSGSLVVLTGNAGGEFVNTGGIIEAVGAGSEVLLTTNASVVGGIVRSTGGGIVRGSASRNYFFTDVTIEGQIEAANNSDFGVSGTIANTGTITLASTFNATDLEIQAGGATLTGGGTLAFQGNNPGINAIANATLTNMDNTIQGEGRIDSPLVNNGSLVGTSATEIIEVNSRLSGDGTLENVRIDNVHAPGDGASGFATASVPVSGEYTIANSGELHLQIGGTSIGEFDQLDSTGTLNLDGDLLITFTDIGNGYVPAAGDQFTVIQSTSALNGAFDNIFLAESGGGLSVEWEPIDFSDPNKIVLEIASTNFFAADYDEDGDVDADDLVVWQGDYGTFPAAHTDGDGDGSLVADGGDLLIWQLQEGLGTDSISSTSAIPEPTALALMLAFTLSTTLSSSRKR